MAHNSQAPQGPEGTPDPAGSTQMFRAFVDDGEPQRRQAPPQQSGPKAGVVIGVIAAVAVLAVVAWLAFA
ncbi:hypothetical protein ACFXKG_06360 [Streptomyces sp. NPDC059255]|uniref:hypothetical protein n=1 Tax=Streptomyces sp. NPDC059255 TaxID=3346793 RepID=UPI0036B1E458